MFVNTTPKFAKKNRDTILPVKTAMLMNYAVAVLLFALTFLFALMLVTYSPDDNCWFKSSGNPVIHNKLGIFGAYFSDILLSMFGFSAWWVVLGIFYLGYRKIIRESIDVGSWFSIVQGVSFIVLMISSSIFEYVTLYYHPSTYLHDGFGGMLGKFFYPLLAERLGQGTTATLMLALIYISFACSFSVYVLIIVEKVGWLLEFLYNQMGNMISRGPIIERAHTMDTIEPKLKPAMVHQPVEIEPDFGSLLDGLDENKETLIKNQNLSKAEAIVHDFEEEISVDNPFAKAGEASSSKPNFFDRGNTASDFEFPSDANSDAEVLPVIKSPKPKVVAAPTRVFKRTQTDGGELPSTDLLNNPKQQVETISAQSIDFVSRSIENKLAEFGVEAAITNAETGPVITRYELLPSRGVRGDKVVGLGKEIARGLALTNVRIVETIPGKNSMGVEVPNFKRQIIYLKEIFDSPTYMHSPSKLTLALGKDIAGNVVVTDLAKMPHLLVAGTTGSGKSVAVNTMILSILFQATAEEVKFIMIDPKMVELSFYQDIPHLLAPVVTDMTQAANALKWTVGEMENRYRTMAKLGCKNLASYNHKISEAQARGEPIPNPVSMTPDDPEPLEKWPYIVVIIDELADLMMVAGKKIEQYIARIAQKARAVGIHLIVATQRPSVDVITGLIKANIPARISFQVSSKIDSRTILDQMGAEALLGQGDMLFLQPGSGILQRVHGAFVNDDELNKVVEFLKSTGEPSYIEEILSGEAAVEIPGMSEEGEDTEKDPIFDEAVKFIYDTKRCSISALQTRFGIGYNRAARIMSHLEQIGMARRNERGSYELLKTE
ncbi:MAG: cell division protein FtsK [Burkholderiales bacterium]|jgi:S-DNA-T family DNA segregation ATPase FtsK/SpoIIIE|nr:cell division protein FtsK [Burkholderiales bacterium]